MTATEALAKHIKLSVIKAGEQISSVATSKAPVDERKVSLTEIIETDSTKPSTLKKNAIRGLVIVAVLAAGVTGYNGLRFLSIHEQTDDAYTTGHMHQVSSRINGTVDNVLVDDNEHVTAGQVLVVLDPRDYEVKVKQAQAALKTAQHQAAAAQSAISLSANTATGKTAEAQGNVSNALASIAGAEAAVNAAQAAIPESKATLAQKQAEVVRAEADQTRYVELAKQGAVSYQQRDTAVRDYMVAKEAALGAKELVKQAYAQLDQAQQTVRSARAQLVQSTGLISEAQASHVQTKVNASQYDVAKAAIEEAEAQLADAQLQLSYTKIVAPTSGRVGKKTVEAGQRLQPGQQLMTLVSDETWVVANYKETQLERMRPGQNVEIKVDTFPHHVFTGKVDSFSPGSGATFALLPSDNATGNFTKIVQRMPVKIRFDAASIKGYENMIVPGMSVVATVKVQ